MSQEMKAQGVQSGYASDGYVQGGYSQSGYVQGGYSQGPFRS